MNIEIDDVLLEQAVKFTGLSIKQTIEESLHLLINSGLHHFEVNPVLTLPQKEWNALLDKMDMPPAPNAKLLATTKRYRDIIG
ncbi:Protein of unknown function (DUF1778) [Beggiatoa alba B18LD]|uniref:Uncharacterized protein n=1 Tax=Beggiatoa alba B18LD TaxID=395493 RepID=I3CE20_9GAMM|nr:DUF1778 domain-containing protein [Beggiatoa alba]EIJ41863.1 Protein of unknown function (DUF1778) [Beggiatoa alba B18LD]